MEAKELRIGNLFEYEKGIYSVNRISDNFIYAKNINGFAPGDFPISKLNPIPLTEEWLLRLGFKKQRRAYKIKNFGCYIFHPTGISFYPAGILDSLCRVDWFNHVHELQNLYYAITKDELVLAVAPTCP